MKKPEKREMLQTNILRWFCIFTTLLFFAAAFSYDTPSEIAEGLRKIVISRDALITDYFALAGRGAAFFNAGLVMALCILMLDLEKIPYTGFTLAAFFINAGFSLWGKNVINILPIIFGVWLYAKVQGAPFARYVYTALFATCLGPFVTEMVYLLPFSNAFNLIGAVLIGIFIGFAMPPLASHTASMHMGYSLFNVGFAAGILAFVMFCVLRSVGIESQTVLVWEKGKDPLLVIGLALYFILVFAVGAVLENGRMQWILKIMRHPGRAVADFVMMDGPGSTLMNMGLMGLFAEGYMIVIGADLNGPILGSILTVFGFAAFGAHLRNYIPVMAGVYLSTFFTQYEPGSPSMLIASLFVVGISPIAGQFGPVVGILAGMLHACIVSCTTSFYGGLNLYNNGFSAGWVAVIMIPLIESFMTHFEIRKRKYFEWKRNER